MNWKLVEHVPIECKLVCLSGMRIGGSKESIEIGGMDNPIIRHPMSNEPYIPGSSLKGKIRSLLEYSYGKVTPEGTPCGCADPSCPVCRVFGPHKNVNHKLGPTRVIFRDAQLSGDSRERFSASPSAKSLNFVEIKTENIINRATGVAANTGLRTQERVPAGTEFDFRVMIRVFEGDDKSQLIGLIRQGLCLLAKEYIGGSGTRGYGEVEFRELRIAGIPESLED